MNDVTIYINVIFKNDSLFYYFLLLKRNNYTQDYKDITETIR